MVEEGLNSHTNNTSFTKEPFSNFNTDFDLGLFLYVFKKNILWIILFVGVAVLGSFLYLRYTSPIYQSNAIIQIEKSNKANQLLKVDDYYETGDISSEIELLRSNLIAKNAIKQLPLEVSYFNKGQFLDFELYRSAPFTVNIFSKDSSLSSTKVDIVFLNRQEGILSWGGDNNRVEKKIVFGEFVPLPFATIKVAINNYEIIEENINSVNPSGYHFIINNLNSLSRELMSKVSIIILNPSAKTVSISVQENNPLKAKEEVVQLIEEFKFYNVERKKQGSKQIVDFLNAQISLVYEEQKRSEKDISNFKRNNNLSEIGEFSSIVADRLNQLDETLVELGLQFSTSNSSWEQLRWRNRNSYRIS
jgi:tyrosine-protein kinase Etk/Wzc